MYDFLESHNSNFKVTGSFFNSGPYAGYLATTLPISIYFLKNKDWFLKSLTSYPKTRWLVYYLFFAHIIGMVLVLPSLGSRASFISITFSFIIIYRAEITMFFNSIPINKIAKLIVLFIVSLLTAVLVLYIKSGSSSGRAMILKNSVIMAFDHLFFGVGFDHFKVHYMAYQAQGFQERNIFNSEVAADNTQYSFNEPLQFLVENGFLITILTVLFLVIVLRSSNKDNKLTELGWIGAGAIFIFSLFSYPSEILPIKMSWVAYLACICGFSQSRSFSTININQQRKVLGYVLICLVVSLFVFKSVKRSFELRKVFMIWQDGNQKYEYGFNSAALGDYSSIYYELKNNGQYLLEYGKSLFFEKEYNEAINVLLQAKRFSDNTIVETTLGDSYLKIGKYDNAEQCYLAAAFMKPNSFYTNYQLLNLYITSKNTKEAIKISERILSLPIKVTSPGLKEIRNKAKAYLVGIKKEGHY
ncbi:O-antigen ligase family protein [Sphingobacterium multivorum]|uniref:O-antigen ligase family protein n=1 Tax=Sphingobacterium multivorum TaxID=28454 RepID=UPI003DA5ADA3